MNETQTNSKKALSNTGENVVVGVVAVLIAAVLLIFVGWDGLKDWFSNPLIWRYTDRVTAEAISKEEEDDEIQLLVYIYNDFYKSITSYDLDIVCGSAVYKIFDFGKDGRGVIAERIYVKKDGSDAAFYKALSGKDVEDIHLKVHVRSMYSGDEKIVKQTGLVKIIGLLIISVVSGLLVAKANIQNQWLRLLLKLLCVPSLVLLFVLMIALSAFGNSGSSSTGRSEADANARSRAAENYKRQAGLRAGAVMTGRPQDAARAQGQMDQSFADMISPGDSQAKRRYQREAGLKAGAVMTGRPQDAARAQGQMDRALADMIAANNSQAKKEYQKWAQHKASAEMRGNKRDAAFAQQQMDRYMAEMLQGK